MSSSSSCIQKGTPYEAPLDVKIEKLCIKKPSGAHLVSPSPVGLKQSGSLPEQKVPCNKVKCQNKPIYSQVGGYSQLGFCWDNDKNEFVVPSASAAAVAVTPPHVCDDEDDTGGDESPVRYVKCSYCFEDHPSYCYICPKKPCTVCYKGLHHPVYCPYYRFLPKGADYDQVKYEIICACGNLFNEDLWVCTFCTGTCPRLKSKYCDICKCRKQHRTHECPKDTVRAANKKVARDRYLSRSLATYLKNARDS
ncbi:hypothetical protein CASFOL_016553 [Castilleja foliolosa]|uniref:Uncharacterized protein n=1 Tax=Castilleja foliolosa TaxID=1961234 RepID=A0ABD3D8K4_9LAMI